MRSLLSASIKAPGLILSNVNYVKKVVFPLEILPVVALGSALFHMLVSVADPARVPLDPGLANST